MSHRLRFDRLRYYGLPANGCELLQGVEFGGVARQSGRELGRRSEIQVVISTRCDAEIQQAETPLGELHRAGFDRSPFNALPPYHR